MILEITGDSAHVLGGATMSVSIRQRCGNTLLNNSLMLLEFPVALPTALPTKPGFNWFSLLKACSLGKSN